MAKRRTRRYLIEITELDQADVNALGIEHQQPPPIQTREPSPSDRQNGEEWNAWAKRRSVESAKAARKASQQPATEGPTDGVDR